MVANYLQTEFKDQNLKLKNCAFYLSLISLLDLEIYMLNFLLHELLVQSFLIKI